MNRIVGYHPGIVGFLLFCGILMAAGCSWSIFFPLEAIQQSDQSLRGFMLWVGAIVGGCMWLWGSVLFGRNFGVNSWVAFLLGLIPLAGLGLTRLIGSEMTPHEAWAKQNPGLDTDKAAKRNYRPMKPLY